MTKIARFKVLAISLFLLIISFSTVLIVLYLFNSLWNFFSFSFLVVAAIFGYVAHKKGWVKPFSPKQRRIRVVFVFGIIISLSPVTVWRVITGPLPSYSFIIFLLLFAGGIYLGDVAGKKFKIF